MVRISLLIPSVKCSPFCPIKALSGPPALAGVFKRSEYVHSIFFSEPSEGSKARRARARDLIAYLLNLSQIAAVTPHIAL